jgi:DNA-binding beta-propeller fold protein YncE
MPMLPFGIVTSADGNWVFVAMTGNNQNLPGGVAILQRMPAGYQLVRTISVQQSANGLAITHDGQLLIAAAGSADYFFDLSGLASGGAGTVALAGSISDGSNAGSVWVSVTPDDQTLFFCDETTGQITVVDLPRARSSRFSQSAILGTIPVAAGPTSIAFSPDGSTAYVTVEIVSSAFGWPDACPVEGSTNPTPVRPQGAIVVFNVAQARSHPSQTVLSPDQFIPAGCSPVRVVRSPDGWLYVTARNSNAVIALDPAKFASDPTHSMIGSAPVGVAPVPVATIDGGAFVVVGNSNRFFEPFTPQSLNIIDAAKLRAGAGAAANVRTLPAGAFPRDLTLSPDGSTLFLSNYISQTVEVIDTQRLGSGVSGRVR